MTLSRFLDPKNDVAFKIIFGSEKNRDILIHFINDILGLEGNDEVQEVTFLSPIQDPEIAAKKQSIVDVLCRDQNGDQFIIEMQVAQVHGFEKRAQYYAAKTYCRQTDRGKEGKYRDLKKIIFIAILDYTLFPEKKAYKSSHSILDNETYENDLKDFSFTFLELDKFKKTDISTLSNIVEKWCYYFKYANETSNAELEKIISGDDVIKRAYEALDQFNWSEQELLSYDQEIKRLWDNAAVEEAALEKAEAKGIAKGKAEVMIEIAKNLLGQNLSIDIISSVTGLSKDEIEKLKSQKL